jgi:hypothetical protein
MRPTTCPTSAEGTLAKIVWPCWKTTRKGHASSSPHCQPSVESEAGPVLVKGVKTTLPSTDKDRLGRQRVNAKVRSCLIASQLSSAPQRRFWGSGCVAVILAHLPIRNSSCHGEDRIPEQSRIPNPGTTALHISHMPPHVHAILW